MSFNFEKFSPQSGSSKIGRNAIKVSLTGTGTRIFVSKSIDDLMDRPDYYEFFRDGDVIGISPSVSMSGERATRNKDNPSGASFSARMSKYEDGAYPAEIVEWEGRQMIVFSLKPKPNAVADDTQA